MEDEFDLVYPDNEVSCIGSRLPPPGINLTSAIEGRAVLESLSASLRLTCDVAPAEGALASLPPEAVVRTVNADGFCAWHALGKGMTRVCGAEKTPSKFSFQSMVLTGAIAHVLGQDITLSSLSQNETKLSDVQMARGQSLRMTEKHDKESDEQFNRDYRTYKWFGKRASWLVSNVWVGVPWLGLAAEALSLNILLWEPTGNGKEVQPYSAWHTRGMFFCGIESKWVHLLYHSAQFPWSARGEVADGGHLCHNHFDTLDLSEKASLGFNSKIAKGLGKHGSGVLPTSLLGLGPLPLASGARGRHRAVGGGVGGGGGDGSGGGGGSGGGSGGDGGEGSDTPRGTGSTCEGIVAQGPRANLVCGAKSKPPGTGRCGKHQQSVGSANRRIGGVKREGKFGRNRGAKGDADPGAEPNYTSDGSIGEEFPLSERGTTATLTKDQKKRAANGNKIAEPEYRLAYLAINKMKDAADELAKKAKEKEEGIEESEEEDEEEDGEAKIGWSDEGIPDFKDTKAHLKRKKTPTSRTFSLTPETLQDLPSLDDLIADEAEVHSILEPVALKCFDKCFPIAAVELLVNKTNAYVEHCTVPPVDAKSKPRKPHQEKKTRTLGHWTLPTPAFETMHIYGMMGLLIVMGLTKKTRMRKHWGKGRQDNYPFVRECMPRDLFELLYCRFLHAADASAAERFLDNGTELNPEFDSKHHIRELEEILNEAWSSTVQCGWWISYDEQMVKSTSKWAHYLMRFNKNKPIPHGVKLWAACDPGGLCYVSSVDGGMQGDPKLREWLECPLGRTARQVLWVLLGACPAFSSQIEDSGIQIAMDNFFTSASLLACLATHRIFAVGTLRKNRASAAMTFWRVFERTVKDRGDMIFARFGEMVFIRWMDSTDLLFCSTIHIAGRSQEIVDDSADGGGDEDGNGSGRGDFDAIEYKLNKSGHGKTKLVLEQPLARKEYVDNMGGVDVADQQNSSHAHDHKSCNNHWRRVMDQKMEQAETNAYLVGNKWVSTLKEEAEGRLSIAKSSGDRVEKAALERVLELLEQLAKVERAKWDEVLSEGLMGRCRVGHAQTGGRQPLSCRSESPWGAVKLRYARKCLNPECTAKTRCGCICDAFCSRDGERGVLMCLACYRNEDCHEAAAMYHYEGPCDDVGGGRRRKPMEWLPVP